MGAGHAGRWAATNQSFRATRKAASITIKFWGWQANPGYLRFFFGNWNGLNLHVRADKNYGQNV